jgi:thymidylate kinase
MLIVAIEGPCGSGKSTLANGLKSRLGNTCVMLGDYASYVIKEKRPRLPAGSVAEELAALEFYLGVDKNRFRVAQHATTVILDRSFHTLLAHVHANDQISHLDSFAAAEAAWRRRQSVPQPDLVIYLELSVATLRRRHREAAHELAPFLTTDAYLTWFRDYFRHRYVSDRTKLIFQDGELSAEKLCEVVWAGLNGGSL